MKTILSLPCVLLAFGLFAEPATNLTAAAENKTLREQGTDEIDLEEADDAAQAAKKAAIKPAARDAGFVDISCDEATLADILRQFRKTTRANIISDDSTNLQKRVSAELKHVPWLEALTSILNSRGYALEERKGIYFVQERKETVPVLTQSFQLRHASSEELARLFNESYAPKDKNGKVIAPIANAFAGANVVVVRAQEPVLHDCERIIKAVDKAVAQVYIEARFLELSSEALHKLGVQWDSLSSWGATAKGLKVGWEHNDGKAANYGLGLTQRSASGAKTDSTVDTDGKTSSTSTGASVEDSLTGLYPSAIGAATGAGLAASDMAWKDASGFSGQLSADDFRLALSAFESLGEGKIFSNPKVIVSNGKEAKVDMTTKFPNITIKANRSSESTNPYLDLSAEIKEIPGSAGHREYDYRDKALFAGSCFYEWGITLSVRPRISSDGIIAVEIVPAISQLDLDTSSTGFYEVKSDVDYGKFPIIQMKRIITDFTMKSGATAVIGGLSRTVEEDVDSGIPYLRKIPWIGPKIFGWKSRQKVQKEIIVCVTLGIADPGSLPEDVGLPTNAVLGREYVEGKRQEPGRRAGGAADLRQLDKRALDEISADKPATGKVVITPSK